MAIYVYHLIDPVTNAVVYIGQSDRPTERYSEHLAGECADTAEMIEDMLQWRRLPVMRIIAEYETWKAAAHASESMPRQGWRMFRDSNPKAGLVWA